MVTRKHILAVLSLILIAAFALSACQPVTTTVEVIKTVEVDVPVEVVTTQEVTVVETQIVEVEKGAFTTPHPILSDLKVRQAMAYCTNKLELIQSVYPLISPEQQAELVMNTFIPRPQWAYAGDENITIYPFDPEKGMALLEEAGWVMDEATGFRAKDGVSLALKFTTTSAAFRQTWAAVFEQQMANCGIQIVRLHAPASWWFGDTTGLARRDYELGAFAWVGQVDPGGQTLYACDQIPFPENGWEGQNAMGWCNEEASVAIKNANNTLLQEDRKKWYTITQQGFTEDVPSIPLFNRTETFATVADLEGFAPTTGEEYYTYNAGEWARPGQDTIVLGFTQEPASLFGLVEDAFVTHLALDLIGANGKQNTSLEYNFQPYHLVEMPTLESGKSVNADVEVKEGDKVIDAEGNIVEALAAGTMLRNAAGEVVEFTGEPVMMKQLTVNFEFRPDLKWPDGEPLKAEDLELGWTIKCDKESGATTFITCDRTASVAFDGTTFTRTELPGGQDPIYQHLTDFYPFPAHRVLSDGRMLKDVPAKEYATLPEIAEQAWGFGPYMIKEWVKGEKMVLEAHPYWFGGTPASPNFIISIITAENAEAQLLGGQVDILDSTTLAGVTETLDAAAKEGKITLFVEAGGTWEHIDIQLWLK